MLSFSSTPSDPLSASPDLPLVQHWTSRPSLLHLSLFLFSQRTHLANPHCLRPHCMCLTRLESLFRLPQPEHSQILIYHLHEGRKERLREGERNLCSAFAGLEGILRSITTSQSYLKRKGNNCVGSQLAQAREQLQWAPLEWSSAVLSCTNTTSSLAKLLFTVLLPLTLAHKSISHASH